MLLVFSAPGFSSEQEEVQESAADSQLGRPSNDGPTMDSESRTFLDVLKRTAHADRGTLWVRTREQSSPERFAAILASLSLSDDVIARDSALDFLWHDELDGELAAALACAIRCRFVAPHLIWLLGRIDPQDKLAGSYLEILSKHDDPRVLGEVALAQGRLRKDDRAVIKKLMVILEQGGDLDLRLQAVTALQKARRQDRELIVQLNDIHRGLQSLKWQQDFDEAVDALRSCIADEQKIRSKTRAAAAEFLKEP